MQWTNLGQLAFPRQGQTKRGLRFLGITAFRGFAAIPSWVSKIRLKPRRAVGYGEEANDAGASAKSARRGDRRHRHRSARGEGGARLYRRADRPPADRAVAYA